MSDKSTLAWLGAQLEPSAHKVWKFTCPAESQDAVVLEVVMETDEGLAFGSSFSQDEVARLNE